MASVYEWQKRSWQHAEDKGFHDKHRATTMERLMLIVSELGEACEALRHGNPPSDHCPELSGLAEELADVVIRVMDLCEIEGIDLEYAMERKSQFNAGRPMLHGKVM